MAVVSPAAAVAAAVATAVANIDADVHDIDCIFYP